MNPHENKTHENKSQSADNKFVQKENGANPTFQLTDNRPEAEMQRNLKEMATNSPRTIRMKRFQEMANNHSVGQRKHNAKKENNVSFPDNLILGIISQQNPPIQRSIIMEGGGQQFVNIFEEFFKFAKDQGGGAYEMLNWFYHGKNNTLEIVSSPLLESKGLTECSIKGKLAHNLTDKDWRTMHKDVDAKITISIKNSKEGPDRNDADQYYTILHELMVHAYPFYKKILRVRNGNGPKSKADAGYSNLDDPWGAHAEHQDLLHGRNTEFYNLFNSIKNGDHGFLDGFNLKKFTDAHTKDKMTQYTDTTNRKYNQAVKTLNKNKNFWEVDMKNKNNPMTRKRSLEILLDNANLTKQNLIKILYEYKTARGASSWEPLELKVLDHWIAAVNKTLTDTDAFIMELK